MKNKNGNFRTQLKTPRVGILLYRIKQKFFEAIHIFGYAFLLSHLTFIPYVHSSPTGGTITGGAGTIDQAGLTTTINQNTSALAIDWLSFDINADEMVNFIQPDSASIALNYILSSSGSQIHGQINANGQVVLVNPNGIFFGSTATVNVGGLIASGLAIDPVDFMNGDYIFNEVLDTEGAVINTGLINASLGGNVVLLGKQVVNEGVISAQLGSVSLAAGKAAVLTFDQQGLLGVQITEAILQDELGIDPAVLNSGEINAAGGRVLLTASVSQDVFSQAVNTGDIQQATSVVVNEDGTFTLGAGADVVNSGTLDVSATGINQDAGQIVVLGENITSSGGILADSVSGKAGAIELHANDMAILEQSSLTSATSGSGNGGDIKVLGDKVGLFDNSVVDASGKLNGGQVLIGGDFQGNNSLVRNASFTYVGENASIKANSYYSGNGGEVIVWADNTTRFYGNIQARGGEVGGDGGFAEVSGKTVLIYDGLADLTSNTGEFGTLLLDPDNIEIVNSGPPLASPTVAFLDDPGGTTSITASSIEDQMLVSNVELQANADIWVQEAITVSSANNLTLRAGDDIEIDAAISLGAGTLTLSQGDLGCLLACDTSNPGGIIDDSDGNVLDIDANLSTNGGNIILGRAGNTFGIIKIGVDDGTPINISTNNAAAGNIIFLNQVIDDAGGNHVILNLEAGTGDITFNDVAGTSADYLRELNISSANVVSLNAVNTGDIGINVVATTINLGGDVFSDGDNDAGDISLTGNVILVSDFIEINSSSSSSDGTITITGTINDDANLAAGSLTLDSGSEDLVIDGAVGNNNALDSLLINDSNNSSVDAITTRDGGITINSSGIIKLGGDLTTNAGTNGGAVVINGDATLTADILINTSTAGTDGTVDFNGTVNTDATTALTALHSLSIDAGTGTVAFNDVVGGTDRLSSLSITNANTITLNDIYTGAIGLTANGATLNLNGNIDTLAGVVDLDSVADLTLTSTITTDGGDVLINVSTGAFSNSSNSGDIDSGTGNVVIVAAGSAGADLGSITTTGTGTLSVTTTGGDITQATGAGENLEIAGASMFDAGTSNINLNNNDNDFAQINLNAGTAFVEDTDDIQIGDTSITGTGNSLEIVAGGDITQVGATTITNATLGAITTLTASGNSITLDEATNDFASVAVNAANVTLEDANSIILNASTVGGVFDITANAGNITQSGMLDISGISTLSAIGNSITLENPTNDFFQVNLSALTASIIDNNAIQIGDTTITGTGTSLSIVADGDMTIVGGSTITNNGAAAITSLTTTSGNFTQNGNISTQGNIQVTSAGSIIMDSSASSNSATGNIQYDANGGDAAIGLLSVSGVGATVSVTTTGEITDNNDGGMNFIGDNLVLRAVSGIGNGVGNDLETQVSVMDVVNSGSSGDIRLDQSGSVNIVAVHNALSSGTISLTSDNDFNIFPGGIIASKIDGTVIMTALSGDILGLNLADDLNPDITGFSGTFFAGGTFGTTGRPIVLNFPTTGDVLVNALTVSVLFRPDTPDTLNITGIDIGELGIVAAISGEQLIEIESLGDIDPAIFTNLRSYSHEDVSILLPRDQLFEDELEEAEEENL